MPTKKETDKAKKLKKAKDKAEDRGRGGQSAKNRKNKDKAKLRGLPAPTPLPVTTQKGVERAGCGKAEIEAEQLSAEELEEYNRRRRSRNAQVREYAKQLTGKGRTATKGTNKEQEDQLTSIAMEMSPAMLFNLYEVATDVYAAPGARTRAANSILDRGYGKAKQKIEVQPGEGLRGLTSLAMRHKLLNTMKEFAVSRGLPFTVTGVDPPRVNGKNGKVKKKAKTKRKKK